MRILLAIPLCCFLAAAGGCQKKAAPAVADGGAAAKARASARGGGDPCAGKPERKVGMGTIQGTFAGIQVGDRIRSFVRGADRRLRAFYVPTRPMAYFLIAHRRRPLTVRYDQLDLCLALAGGYRRVERMVSVAAGTVTDKAWWSARASDPAAAGQARKAYEDYVEGPFRKGDQ